MRPSKCEIYTNDPVNVFQRTEGNSHRAEPRCVVIRRHPFLEQTVASVHATANRVKQSADAITAFAAYCPAQALQLFRATAGACNVEYLLQTLTPSTVTRWLAEHCSTEYQRAFAANIQHEPADCATWALIMIPQRLGGLGLRDLNPPSNPRASLP